MKINRATFKTRDTRVIAGIDKHIAASIMIDGTPYTHADPKAVFQSPITVLDSNAACWRTSRPVAGPCRPPRRGCAGRRTLRVTPFSEAANGPERVSGTIDAKANGPEVVMSPFLASSIACSYMASVFVVFGVVPRRLAKGRAS